MRGQPEAIVRRFAKIVQTISDRLAGYPIDPNTGAPDLTKPRMLTEYDKNITSISYEHGHPREIVNALIEKTKDEVLRFEKYPLVMLFQDIPVNRNSGDYDTARLHIVIAMRTEQGYRSFERQEKVFEPVLYPIYRALLAEIAAQHGYFRIQDPQRNMAHRYYDRLFWGREGLYGNEGNVFNDFIDAIEILDLELTLSPGALC